MVAKVDKDGGHQEATEPNHPQGSSAHRPPRKLLLTSILILSSKDYGPSRKRSANNPHRLTWMAVVGISALGSLVGAHEEGQAALGGKDLESTQLDD
jgi:hypothetical protein